MDEGLKESVEELAENGKMWKSWVMVAIVILTWIVSAAVQWGFNSAHAQDNERRLGAVEAAMEKKIDRAEYDSRQKDIIDRLQRIEDKLDGRR